MINAVIYARYSSHNQTECSIEGQLEECKRFAELSNYNVIRTYIDRAKSGTKDNREEFLKMIEDSKKKEFKYIIVYQLDRFARNRYDSAIYKKQLKGRDIRVLSARENINDDASGVLMESVLEGMAEYYSVELGQKVKRGMNYNGENFYYNGGTVPLGFKLEEITINIENSLKPVIKKKYILDAEKVSIVQKIFEMYANGSKMVEIISVLNSLGVKTAYNKSFNKSSIRRILENKKYIGTYTYNGIETKDAIPRIISDELFNRVQMELVRNGLAPSRSRAKNEYLLTGKLYCGDCKEKMTGTSGTSKTKDLHTYYICKNSKVHKNCNKKRIKKDYLEDLIVLFAKSTLTNENINQIAKKIVDIANNEQNNQVLKTINKNIADNEKKKNNLLQAIAECEDAIVRKTLFDEIAKLTQLDAIYNNALIEEKSKHLQLNYKEVKYFLTQIKNNNINDFKYKKMLINILINKVYIYTNKAVIVYNVSNVEQEIDLSLINNIECSLVDSDALPLRFSRTNVFVNMKLGTKVSSFYIIIRRYNMSILTDQEYNKKMEELGFIEDPDYKKYFLGDMAFLMNVDDNVSQLGDLVQFNSNNHPTYMTQVLMDFSSRGAKLVIGPGTIDEYGIKKQKALYCTNYRELFPKKENNSVTKK